MKKKRDNVISIDNKYTINEKKRKKREQKIKKFAKFRTIIIFACCLGALTYVFSKKNEQEQIYDEKVADNQQLEEEVAALQEQEAELQQSIESLSDPETLAKIARDEYYLSGPDETIFIVPEENTSDTADGADETIASETESTTEETTEGSGTEDTPDAAETSTPEDTAEESTGEQEPSNEGP